ncbi:MAG: hypothetical protein U9N86_04505 [Bacteroidota bacterium]|nr:hypothetical protein [Bacteroidota bacterium]
MRSKISNIYDSNGNKLINARYRWDFYINDWATYEQFKRSYDLAGNLTCTEHYWSAGLLGWTPNWRQDASFDSFGNQTQDISYFWSSDLNNWTPRRKIGFMDMEVFITIHQLFSNKRHPLYYWGATKRGKSLFHLRHFAQNDEGSRKHN